MSLKDLTDAVVPFTPAADYTDKQGYLVNLAGDTATISTSATVVVKGVILEGSATTGQTSVAILGASPGAVKMKAGGAITKGAFVAQHTDGTIITDAGSGARVIVGVALETAASGDLITVAPITPRPYAS